MLAPSRLAAVMLTCTSLDSHRCGTPRSSSGDVQPGELFNNILRALLRKAYGSEIEASSISKTRLQQQEDVDPIPHVDRELQRLVADRELRRMVTAHVRISDPRKSSAGSDPRQLKGLATYFADEKRVVYIDDEMSKPKHIYASDQMPSAPGSCRCEVSVAQEHHPQTASHSSTQFSGLLPPFSPAMYLYLCIYSYVGALVLSSLEGWR